MASSLMDAARQEAAAQGGVPVAGTSEGKGKVKKSQGAAYQRKVKEQRYADGLAFKEYLTKIGKLQEVQADATLGPALERYCKKPGTGQSFGGLQTPVIYRLFGDAPKVGQRITGLDVYRKTNKGYNEFKQVVRKWAEKGVCKVSYDEKTDPANPSWVITEVGTLPPKAVTAQEA